MHLNRDGHASSLQRVCVVRPQQPSRSLTEDQPEFATLMLDIISFYGVFHLATEHGGSAFQNCSATYGTLKINEVNNNKKAMIPPAPLNGLLD